MTKGIKWLYTGVSERRISSTYVHDAGEVLDGYLLGLALAEEGVEVVAGFRLELHDVLALDALLLGAPHGDRGHYREMKNTTKDGQTDEDKMIREPRRSDRDHYKQMKLYGRRSNR